VFHGPGPEHRLIAARFHRPNESPHPRVWRVWRFPGTVPQATCLPLAETAHRLSLTFFAA